MVRPAGIEPATLSLEDRSGHAAHNKFNAFGLQDEAECDRSPSPTHHPRTIFSHSMTPTPA